MRNTILYLFLALLFIGDTWYSFDQFYHGSLDGDIADNVVPAPDYKKVLEDPLGFNVLFKKEPCAAPNRFFAHWTMLKYFNSVPLILQPFVKPVDSVYLSCAIVKTLLQVFIIFLLSTYITGRFNPFKVDFLIAAVLITPLFQASGYSVYMAVIDPSITYTFFYALPLSLCLLFFLPFYRIRFSEKKGLSFFDKAGLIFLAFFLAFNGPLIPGVILVICPLILLIQMYSLYKKSDTKDLFKIVKDMSNGTYFFFILICFLCLYSLYIGTYNTDSFKHTISLSERYSRIPAGLFEMVSQKLGWPVLLLMIGINIFLIRKYFNNAEGKKIIHLLKWIGVFSVIYILLLPLGGFRIYRPNVVRYDTIMPVTISMIFVYGLSAFFLIKSIVGKNKLIYLALVAVFMFVYANADEPVHDNDCERAALEKLAKSPDIIVSLDTTCKVMSWEKISDYKGSEINCILLRRWGVIKGEKYYYQK
ncbi:MAG: hypothetical protein ACXVPN_01120 [Bacteroidia bacterium]